MDAFWRLNMAFFKKCFLLCLYPTCTLSTCRMTERWTGARKTLAGPTLLAKGQNSGC